MVEASIREGDPVAISHSQTQSKSQRSDNKASRHSKSFVIRPTGSTRTVDVSQPTPATDPPQAPYPREAREVSGDSESVSKRSRHD